MLKNLEISTRLIVSYLIIAAMLLAAGIMSVLMIRRVGNTLDDFHNTSYRAVTASWKGRWALASLRADLYQAISANEPAQIQELIASSRNERANLDDAYNSLLAEYTGNDNYLEELHSGMTELDRYLDTIRALAQENDDEAATDLLTGTYMTVSISMRSILDKMGEAADGRASEKVADADSTQFISTITMGILIVVTMAIAMFMGLYMSRSIVTPVNEMQEVTLAVSKGDFESVIRYESSDALGHLADNMRNLTGTIKEIITDVEMQLSAMGQGNFNVRSRSHDLPGPDGQRNPAEHQQLRRPGQLRRRTDFRQRPVHGPGRHGTGVLRTGTGGDHRRNLPRRRQNGGTRPERQRGQPALP